jgi:hypothetical protein
MSDAKSDRPAILFEDPVEAFRFAPTQDAEDALYIIARGLIDLVEELRVELAEVRAQLSALKDGRHQVP